MSNDQQPLSHPHTSPGVTEHPSSTPVEEILDVRPGAAHERHGRGGRRSAYATRDLTRGSVSRNLWFLAWPQMVEGAFNALDQMADLFWAGRVAGFRSLGGLGVAQAYTHLLAGTRHGLDMGMQAMIARAVGAGRIDLANHVALQGFTLTFLFSLVMVLPGFLLAEPLMRILGVSDTVIAQTSSYLRVQFVGTAVMGFRMNAATALQASGDALTPMKATVLARVLHLVVSPFLIFGWWGLPAMGITGAAVANTGAQFLALLWNLYALFAGTSRLHLTLRGYRVDLPLLWRLVKIGGPASFTTIERTISQLVLLRFITPFGDAALAAFSLTRRLEFLTGMGQMGLGRASGVLVGQNLGAGSPDRAATTVRWALGYVTAISVGLALLLIAFPGFFVSIFSEEEEFLAVAVIWLRIQVVAGTLQGIGTVLLQSLYGAGDTLAPMVVILLSQWGVEVPAAFALSRYTSLGQYGIPLAAVTGMATRLVLFSGYFARGRWKRVKVL